MKLVLPYPVLPPTARPQVAQRLGVTIDDVEMLLQGTRGWYDGRLVDASAFESDHPQLGPDQYSGTGVLPPDLIVTEIDVERDPRQPFTPPITAVDLAAADVVRLADFLTWAQTSGVASLTRYRWLLQNACDATLTADDALPWRQQMYPISDLGLEFQPGAVGTPLPHAWFLATKDEAINVLACDVVRDGYLVHFGFASVVLRPDGEVRDLFPNNGNRAVGSDSQFVMLASNSRPFTMHAYVRDMDNHRWVTGPIPPSLPRHTAGVVIDRMPIVIDHDRGVYCNIQPRAIGETETVRTSACGRFVWDSSTFVREALTGRPVFDARWVPGDVISFAQTTDGWRFVMCDQPQDENPTDWPSLRLLSETGDVVRQLDVGTWDFTRIGLSPVALSADGTQLLEVRESMLRVLDADTDEPAGQTIDLRPLHTALDLPDDSELWAVLASVYAIPHNVAHQSVDGVLADLANTFAGEHLEDAGLTRTEILDAISVAKNRQRMPTALPTVPPHH
jgi:hypothetical protein